MQRHFWFVDDDQHIRWAVRLSQPFPADDRAPDFEARIVFTSLDRQITTEFVLAKPENELSQYELLELLAQAKREEMRGDDGAIRLHRAA